jgi:hypothetical protein
MKYNIKDLLVLWRLAQNIEEPHRSISLHQLKNAITYKNHLPPPTNLPIKIPFMAHPRFKSQFTTFIKHAFVQPHKTSLPTFHLPTTKPQETPHPTIAGTLFNSKTWLTTFCFQKPTTCNCNTWLTKHPNLPTRMAT